MNEFGDLAGWSPAGAFRWSPHSGLVVLGTFPLPSDINEAGDIVGMARFGDSVSAEPFLWTPARTYRLLPEVLGENNAEALNNVRQVVGWAEGSVPTGWDSMAVLWAPATGLVPLWPTNGEDGMMSSTVDINDQGIVVGKAEMPVRPGIGGTLGIVLQLHTPPSRIASALRVRITEARRRGVIKHGVARALLTKLDHFDRTLQAGRATKVPAQSLQKQILVFARTGALPESHALPLHELATVLTAKR